jgi:hypothetical protein
VGLLVVKDAIEPAIVAKRPDFDVGYSTAREPLARHGERLWARHSLQLDRRAESVGVSRLKIPHDDACPRFEVRGDYDHVIEPVIDELFDHAAKFRAEVRGGGKELCLIEAEEERPVKAGECQDIIQPVHRVFVSLRGTILKRRDLALIKVAATGEVRTLPFVGSEMRLS